MAVILIKLDNPAAFFDVGEVLTGHVVVYVESPLTVRGVHISFMGEANVYWKQGDNSYRNHETILDHSITVWGDRGPSTPTLDMPVGQHTFNFAFPIPLTRTNGSPLPSSFRGWSGNIRYHVKAQLERPKMRFDIREEELINIRGASYDLSADPRTPVPQETHDRKTVCCWCCASGRIEAELRTDKTGYVPGESIRVFAKVINHSMKNIHPISLRLIQKIHYVSWNGRTKNETVILNAIDRDETLRSGKTLTLDDERLLIPTENVLPTISLGSCDILQVGYQVQLHVNPNGCSLAFNVETDVVLGAMSLVGVRTSGDSSDVSST